MSHLSLTTGIPYRLPSFRRHSTNERAKLPSCQISHPYALPSSSRSESSCTHPMSQAAFVGPSSKLVRHRFPIFFEVILFAPFTRPSFFFLVRQCCSPSCSGLIFPCSGRLLIPHPFWALGADFAQRSKSRNNLFLVVRSAPRVFPSLYWGSPPPPLASRRPIPPNCAVLSCKALPLPQPSLAVFDAGNFLSFPEDQSPVVLSFPALSGELPFFRSLLFLKTLGFFHSFVMDFFFLLR